MPTKIKLVDGVSDGGRHVTEITLRDIGFFDVVAMTALDLSQLSNSLQMVSRLSGAPMDLLQWMTQGDTLLVLTAFNEHYGNFLDRAGF